MFESVSPPGVDVIWPFECASIEPEMPARCTTLGLGVRIACSFAMLLLCSCASGAPPVPPSATAAKPSAANVQPTADPSALAAANPTAARPAVATAPAAAQPSASSAPTQQQPRIAPSPTALPTARPKSHVVAIDPGHGGSETGAVHVGTDGNADLLEKNVNLEIALILAQQLTDAGYTAVLTRTADTPVNRARRDLNGDGVVDNDDDLQARVDIANEAGAEVFLSIHNNGVDDAQRRGTSTWYSASHPLGAQARTFARLVQKELLAGLGAAGYTPRDEGANDDPPLGKPFGHLFVTGPKTPRVARIATMPSIVAETLYVTNDTEAGLLKTKRIQQAIAQADVRAIDAFLNN